MPNKICTCCNVEKPLSDFGLRGGVHYSACKPCKTEKQYKANARRNGQVAVPEVEVQGLTDNPFEWRTYVQPFTAPRDRGENMARTNNGPKPTSHI